MFNPPTRFVEAPVDGAAAEPPPPVPFAVVAAVGVEVCWAGVTTGAKKSNGQIKHVQDIKQICPLISRWLFKHNLFQSVFGIYLRMHK